MSSNSIEKQNINIWEIRKSTNEALQKAKLAFNSLSEEGGWTKMKNKKPAQNLKQSHVAIDTAQENIIKELKNQFALKKNFIDTGLKHQVNFSDTTIINTVGLITVDVGGHPYEFSKQRFFENKHFQNRVRDAFLSIFPTGFLVFFKGHEEGTFCIKIIPRN